ncbi:MAG: hypothetical protein IPG18_10720 [Saprospiraceae bacterium]|nr:hypothetical protein [Saprospiraceae bacterium]
MIKRRLESGGGIHPDVFVQWIPCCFDTYPEIETDLVILSSKYLIPSFKNIELLIRLNLST